nr:epidermal patterning factor 1 [Tanacetum cinerariifolium]
NRKPQRDEQEEAKVEDYDERNIDDMWDITVKDVERLRRLLIPTIHTLPEPNPVVQPYVPLIPFFDELNVERQEEPDNDINSIPIHVHDVMDDVIQPLIPQTIRTTRPDKNYVAPATKPILDELLEEFRDEILNITVDDEKVDCNPIRDIEELEILLTDDTQSHFIEKKGHSVVVKTNEKSEPFIHTQQLSPLYGIIKSFKSSAKPCKVEREMKSPFKYDFNISFPYPVAYLHLMVFTATFTHT